MTHLGRTLEGKRRKKPGEVKEKIMIGSESHKPCTTGREKKKREGGRGTSRKNLPKKKGEYKKKRIKLNIHTGPKKKKKKKKRRKKKKKKKDKVSSANERPSERRFFKRKGGGCRKLKRPRNPKAIRSLGGLYKNF